MFASIIVMLSVLTLFGDCAPSTAKFSQDCKPYPGKRVVLLTVDSEFMDFFQNWLIHAKPFITKTEQIVVVPEDERAVTLLSEAQRSSNLSFDVLPVKGRAGKGKRVSSLLRQSTQTRKFGSQAYNALVAERPTHIANFIGHGCTVLYVDIDSAWAKDPFEEIALSGKHSLYLIDDSPGNRMKTLDNTWHACTCLLYLEPTKAVRGLVRKWSMEVESDLGSQQALNKVLREDYESNSRVDFKLLPFGMFPPGKVGHHHKDATIYHANHHKGLPDKIDYMMQMGVWKV